MARTDSESILDDIKTFLQANLNTAITAINTEKADSVTVPSVSNDAYFLQVMDHKIANFNQYLIYAEEKNDLTAIGAKSAQRITYVVAIVLVTSNNEAEEATTRTLFRYRRVLMDLFTDNWRRVNRCLKFEVKALQPDMFKIGGKNHRAIGVSVETDLT